MIAQSPELNVAKNSRSNAVILEIDTNVSVTLLKYPDNNCCLHTRDQSVPKTKVEVHVMSSRLEIYFGKKFQ